MSFQMKNENSMINQNIENVNLKRTFPEIIGNSSAIKKIMSAIIKIAKCDAAVLISGESGTGKELAAAALHRLSSRRDKSFIALNCSAIPEQLLEAELFGHEKGAFTGADKKREGLLEAANGGCIFLDEIGDMPLSLQAKLLRVLQQKQFTRLGSNSVINTDIRIIAATHVNLRKAIEEGRFRQDLYYRLNVLPIDLPPLRARADDIEPLAQTFLQSCNRIHMTHNPCFFNEEVLKGFAQYNWPGNIRELQNVVERMAVYAGGGALTKEHLPHEITDYALDKSTPPNTNPSERLTLSTPQHTISTEDLPSEGFSLSQHIEELENQYILAALSKTNNNKNQAAKLLGLNRTTLVEKIKRRNLG